MRNKLTILVFILSLVVGAQLGLFTPEAAEAGTCETFCGEAFEGCVCCSTCCEISPGHLICSPGACLCP